MNTIERRAVLGWVPSLLVSTAAGAQSLAEIDQRRAAVIEAWERTPLTVRRAIFVSQKPPGYGMFEQRPGTVFKPGEPLLVYAEPIGYGWKPVDGGMYEFGFAIDFAVKSAKGEVLGSKDDFGRLSQRSHVRNQEFMLTLTMDLTGAPQTDLVLAYKLRDITGPKATTFELPFSIRA